MKSNPNTLFAKLKLQHSLFLVLPIKKKMQMYQAAENSATELQPELIKRATED